MEEQSVGCALTQDRGSHPGEVGDEPREAGCGQEPTAPTLPAPDGDYEPAGDEGPPHDEIRDPVSGTAPPVLRPLREETERDTGRP